MNDVPVGELTLEKFSASLGTKFRVGRAPAPPLDLVLVEAAAVGGDRRAAGDRAGFRQGSFSLLFHGPAEPLLPQHTYSVEHDQIGRFDLFLVPVGREPGAIHYQVIFNRLLKPD